MSKIKKGILLGMIIVYAISVFFILNSRWDGKYVGTYQTTTWNGTTGTLALDENHRVHGVRAGEWRLEDDKIIIYHTGACTEEELEIIPDGFLFLGHTFTKVK